LIIVDDHNLRLVAHRLSRLISTRPHSNLNAEAENVFNEVRPHP